MPHTHNNCTQSELRHQPKNSDAAPNSAQQHYTVTTIQNTATRAVTTTATTSSHLLDSTSTDDSGFCCSLELSDGSTATSFSSSFETSSSQIDSAKTVPAHFETPTYQQPSTAASSRSSSIENITIGHHSSSGSHVEESRSSKWSATQVSGGAVYVAPIGHLHTAEHAALSPVWVNGGGGHHSTSPAPGEQSPASKKQLLYGMFSRSDDGTRWQCEECKRLFSSQGSLRAHARIHTGERPYQCQYCYRTFCQASTLRSHERLHTGEKPYKCEHCGRAFTQSAGLRSHLKTHRYDS